MTYYDHTERPTKAHGDDPYAARWGETRYRMGGVRETIDTTGTERVNPDLWLTCSYCGSVTPEDFLRFCQMPGMRYSGSDWKYGFPHKFYLTVPCEAYERVVSSTWQHGKCQEVKLDMVSTRYAKFYTKHFEDATDAQLAEYTTVGQPLFGIEFGRDETGRIYYRAPQHGYQAWGVVGGNREDAVGW